MIVYPWSLQTECLNLGLETFYRTYVQRLQRSYLSVFFVMHTIIGVVHTIVLVATQKVLWKISRNFYGFSSITNDRPSKTQGNAPISPEVYCYLASIFIVWISLVSSFNEDLIRKHPWVPHLASCATVMGLVLLDILVPLYHSIFTHVVPPLRPSYDSYILFVIYIFLPIPDNLNCAILGAATSICYLLVTSIMTYRLDEHIITKVSARRCLISYRMLTVNCDTNSILIERDLIFVLRSLSLSRCLADIHRFYIFILCKLFWYLFPFNERSGHTSCVSGSTRMRRRESIVTLCQRSRGMCSILLLRIVLCIFIVVYSCIYI